MLHFYDHPAGVGVWSSASLRSWESVTTLTDRPKSVRSRYAIEVFLAFLCCHISCEKFLLVRGFCHGAELDFFFS